MKHTIAITTVLATVVVVFNMALAGEVCVMWLTRYVGSGSNVYFQCFYVDHTANLSRTETAGDDDEPVLPIVGPNGKLSVTDDPYSGEFIDTPKGAWTTPRVPGKNPAFSKTTVWWLP